MFDSNMNNNYGGYTYNPNGPINIRKETSLTREEYDSLMKTANPFNLTLTEVERNKGICNHMNFEGTQDMLSEEGDGVVRCNVCGYVFKPIDTENYSIDDIREACLLVTDILQTIKMLYIDMPVQSQREYFQIIPLIDKIPQLFQLACANFQKHENSNHWGYRGQNMNTMQMFNTLSGIFGGNGMGMPYNNGYNQAPGYSYSNQPNPVFQQGQQDPNQYQGGGTFYNSQNTYNPQQNFNNMPVGSVPPSNGFGYIGNGPMYSQPQQAYQPQNTGFQYNPNQSQQQNAGGTFYNYQGGQQVASQYNNGMNPPTPNQQYQVTPPVVPQSVQTPSDTKAQTDGQTVSAQATFTS